MAYDTQTALVILFGRMVTG